MSQSSIVTGLTAAGTTQGGALVLNPVAYSQISTCGSGAGVLLPLAQSGMVMNIRNDGANNAKVYPPSSGTINALSANVAITLLVGDDATFVTSNGLSWYQFSSASSSIPQTGSSLVLGSSATLTTTLTATAPAAAVVYTLPDVAASCNVLLGIKKVVSIAAATTSQSLSQAQSGSLVLIPQVSANVTITLPSVLAGLSYRFVCTATANGSNTCTIAAGSAIIKGSNIAVAAGLVPVTTTGASNIVLGATAANLKNGDWCQLECDGTNWFYYAASSGTAAAWTTS